MSLPRRQQRVLDQIEQTLHAADPRLRSLFASFASLTQAPRTAGPGPGPGPRVESLPARPSARTLVVFAMVVVTLLGVLALGIRSTSNDCPGLSSDQAVAPAATRFAGCSPSTDAWSRGGR